MSWAMATMARIRQRSGSSPSVPGACGPSISELVTSPSCGHVLDGGCDTREPPGTSVAQGGSKGCDCRSARGLPGTGSSLTHRSRSPAARRRRGHWVRTCEQSPFATLVTATTVLHPRDGRPRGHRATSHRKRRLLLRPVPSPSGSTRTTSCRPKRVVAELCHQAGIALRNGFDGVMTSEHHGGFAGYMAQPLQMASFVLAEHEVGWAAAAPLLLPLRPTALVAEEVAWLRARHPGRVGLGVAAGCPTARFRSGRREPGRFGRSRSKLSCRGWSPCSAVTIWDSSKRTRPSRPVEPVPFPVLSAAVSTTAATRAARCGAGILLEGMSSPERFAALTRAFDEADGQGAKVLIRRVWLGRSQSDLIEAQRAVYESYAAPLDILRGGPDDCDRRPRRHGRPAGGRGAPRSGPTP